MAESAKDRQPPAPPPTRRGWATSVAREAGLAGQTAFAKAGFSDPSLLLHWEHIAGPETARLARPVRLTEGPRGGVLTLMAEPGAALFLQHESRALCERINGFLGRPAVGRLRFLEGALASRPAPRPVRTAPGLLPPDDPAQKYQGPEGLRAALLMLARRRRSQA